MKNRFALLIFLFSLFMTPGFAPAADESAQADSERVSAMKRIDAAIADTDYNTALDLLNLYIKRYPTYFDEAQKRIKKIMTIRDQYAAIAQSLIDVISDDPENNEKKLEIISQLERLEKHPTEEHLTFIRQAKIAAQFAYYRSVFSRLMARAGVLTESGQYQAAVDTCAEGFPLYREEFFEQADPAAAESVNESLDQLNEGIVLYKARAKAADDACDAFIRAVQSGDNRAARTSFASVQNSMEQVAFARNMIARSGRDFERRFSLMKEADPELTDSSFLPFISRFTLGIDSVPGSGVLGAVDAHWNDCESRMKQAVYEEILLLQWNFASNVSVDDLFAGILPPREQLHAIQAFAGLGISVNGLYALLDTKDGSIYNPCPQYNASMNFMSKLSSETASQFSDVALYRTGTEASSGMTPSSPGYAGNLLASARSFSRIADRALGRISADWFSSRGVLVGSARSGTTVSDPVLDWKDSDTLFSAVCSGTATRAEQQAASFWGQVALYYAEQGEHTAELYTGQYEHANELFVSALSAETLALLSRMQTNMARDRETVVEYKNTLLDGGKYRRTFEIQSRRVDAAIAVLDSLSLQGAELASRAEEQVHIAELALNEADLRYEQASSALSARNFADAREKLQRARAKYNESLSAQESAAVREASDRKLLLLGQRIAQAENQIVVSDVRNLKTQARAEYYNGNFERAESLLSQAKKRWELTNIEEDAEISNLMALVMTALSMKMGRTIAPTAPLYPEMSQILSIAHQYYDEGRRLMADSRQAEAREILIKAKDKLHELQLIYPLNRDASLLSLRIDQLLDPAAFSALFAERMTAAKEAYKKPETSQLAYATLLDLYAVDPKYPGLKQLIYDVEIAVGIRMKPVDKTDERRAEALVQEARRLMDGAGGNEAALRTALAKVDDALKLHPDNKTAAALKDKIQLAVGGTAVVVLSSADEQRYQQAIQELQKNNIINANAIVEQLLQSGSNRRSTKILELQKKIKALL